MPQALEQARRWMERAHAAGAVGHDQNDELGIVMDDLDLQFAHAAAATERLAEALGTLHEITAHLTGVPLPTRNSADSSDLGL